jgi:acetolactate decarboxylase
VIDEVLIRALHVETLRRDDLHAEHEPHVLFQASTIGALLDGAYDGDVTFAELAEHGDLGLGTCNGLDGEMIAVDGRFFRAAVDGDIDELSPAARTPFAIVVWFTEAIERTIDGPISQEALTELIDSALPAGAVAAAIRLDGEFALVRARSVPRQSPPYRPLGEVVAEQHTFELADVAGTLVGFRFPDYSQGLEVAGYHLHFIDAERRRGGHVLDCRPRSGRLLLDHSADLHVELPAGVDFTAPDLSRGTADAIARVERAD